MMAEEWGQGEAESWAAIYAGGHAGVREDVARDEALRDKLRRWMELNDVTQIIDGETGMGVELGPPASVTTWDTRSMPDAMILSLCARGLLTVNTTAFDALRKSGDGADLMDAERYRIRGERAAPVRVVMR